MATARAYLWQVPVYLNLYVPYMLKPEVMISNLQFGAFSTILSCREWNATLGLSVLGKW